MGILTLIFFVTTCWLAWDKWKNSKVVAVLREQLQAIKESLEEAEEKKTHFSNLWKSSLAVNESLKGELDTLKSAKAPKKAAAKKPTTKRTPRKRAPRKPSSK